MKNIFKLFAFSLLLLFVKIAAAQKLPRVQKVSLRGTAATAAVIGPDTIAEQFQAYNPNNRIFYTISNDDDNLYLSVGFPGWFETEKFAVGGVTFSVKTKAGKANAAFTYPVTLYTHNGIEEGIHQFSNLKDDAANNREKLAELPYIFNQKILKTFINIAVKGATGVPDTIQAIKNNFGLKAIAAYDKNMSMVYHLTVPLKYLELNGADSFMYDLKMNGTPAVEKIAPNTYPPPIIVSAPGEINYDYEYMNSPTHATGEYKLAVK